MAKEEKQGSSASAAELFAQVMASAKCPEAEAVAQRLRARGSEPFTVTLEAQGKLSPLGGQPGVRSLWTFAPDGSLLAVEHWAGDPF